MPVGAFIVLMFDSIDFYWILLYDEEKNITEGLWKIINYFILIKTGDIFDRLCMLSYFWNCI